MIAKIYGWFLMRRRTCDFGRAIFPDASQHYPARVVRKTGRVQVHTPWNIDMATGEEIWEDTIEGTELEVIEYEKMACEHNFREWQCPFCHLNKLRERLRGSYS